MAFLVSRIVTANTNQFAWTEKLVEQGRSIEPPPDFGKQNFMNVRAGEFCLFSCFTPRMHNEIVHLAEHFQVDSQVISRAQRELIAESLAVCPLKAISTCDPNQRVNRQ